MSNHGAVHPTLMWYVNCKDVMPINSHLWEMDLQELFSFHIIMWVFLCYHLGNKDILIWRIGSTLSQNAARIIEFPIQNYNKD